MGNHQVAQASGDSLTRSQERVGRLPVTQLPGSYRVAPQSADSTASVPEVGQAPGGPTSIRFTLESPAPPLVHSDLSLDGGGLQCPVPAVDRVVTLRLSPEPSPRDSNQDQVGSGGGGHRHHPQFTEEILVPSTPLDDVQDPTPGHMQMVSPVTTPAR